MIRFNFVLSSAAACLLCGQLFLACSFGADTDGDGLLDLLDVPGFDPMATEIPVRFYSHRGIADLDGANLMTRVLELSLGYNHVTSIEEGDFTGLASLRELSLSSNDISSIERGDFSGLPNLRTLSLSSNELRSIESDDFLGPTNLEALNLDRNQIGSVGSDDFRDLPGLEGLRLYGNGIATIQSGAFADKNNLYSLQLRMNDISELNLQGAEFGRIEPCQYGELGFCVDNEQITGVWLDEAKLRLSSFNAIIGELNAITHASLTALNFTDEYPPDLSALLGIPTLTTVDVDQDLFDRYTNELLAFEGVDGNSVTVIAAGDFDRDGQLSAADIDSMSVIATTNPFDPVYDLNNDGEVTFDDRAVWVRAIKQTYFGDSNLDGEFDSTDLVTVFSMGEYEDAMQTNSTWSDGDWNGDREFTTADLVIAMQDGGYEQGPRASVSAVPEPSTALLMVLAAAFTVPTSRPRRF